MLFSAVVEALGLHRASRPARGGGAASSRAVGHRAFLERLREHGYTPQRVHFAGRRYARWLDVNPAATVEAQGKMLGELWGTYRLSEVEPAWPDTPHPLLPADGLRRRAAGARGGARPRSCSAPGRCRAGGLDLEEQVAAVGPPSAPPPRRTTSSPA